MRIEQDGYIYIPGVLVTREEFIQDYVKKRTKENWKPLNTGPQCTDSPECECCRIKTYLENRVRVGLPLCRYQFHPTCSCECCDRLRSELAEESCAG